MMKNLNKGFGLLLLPFFSTLIVGISLYIFYLAQGIFIQKLSLQTIIQPLVEGGFLFVLMNFNCWYLLSIALTPTVLIFVFLAKKIKITVKDCVMSVLLSLPISFATILLFLFIHLAIGVGLSI